MKCAGCGRGGATGFRTAPCAACGATGFYCAVCSRLPRLHCASCAADDGQGLASVDALAKPWPPEAAGCAGCVWEIRTGEPAQVPHVCGADSPVPTEAAPAPTKAPPAPSKAPRKSSPKAEARKAQRLASAKAAAAASSARWVAQDARYVALVGSLNALWQRVRTEHVQLGYTAIAKALKDLEAIREEIRSIEEVYSRAERALPARSV